MKRPRSGLEEDELESLEYSMGHYNVNMTCPHCLRDAVFGMQNATFDLPAFQRGGSVTYIPKYGHCPSPECGRLVILAEKTEGKKSANITVLPRVRAVSGSGDVPKEIMDDYVEAMQVLEISPNASAALARRCLQSTIRKLHSSCSGRLREEIVAFRESSLVPPYLKGSLDEIRILGNRGAHPDLDAHTDMIVKVDPDDAAWLLRVLEDLFKYCFVAPMEHERRTERQKSPVRPDGKPDGSRDGGGA